MRSQALRGLPVTGGATVGLAAVVPDRHAQPPSRPGGPVEVRRVSTAFSMVAEQLAAWAALAHENEWFEEAEILNASYLIAIDPMLLNAVSERAVEVAAEFAVQDVVEQFARQVDETAKAPMLGRGSDIRELGNRVVRLLSGQKMLRASPDAAVVVARDLGPADIAELRLGSTSLEGLALAEGATTSHVAIMIRALGLPCVVGLGDALLRVTDGERVFLDGTKGMLVVRPDRALVERGELESRERRGRPAATPLLRPGPSTADGKPIGLLCNASTVAEVDAGLAAGVEGVGLIRTELAFLSVSDWPSEQQHRAMLAPLLDRLRGRVATVRTLDFGREKMPKFLERQVASGERGIELMLADPDSVRAQLRAILQAGRETRLRILLPFVEGAAAVGTVRELLAEAVEATGWKAPQPVLGVMIETPQAVASAARIMEYADFVSVGTNDLVQYTLGLDRELPLAAVESAANPRVLRLVADIVSCARNVGIPVAVCGEAASEPAVAVLLVGLGVSELSVLPARAATIRESLETFVAAEAATIATKALGVTSTAEVLALSGAILEVRGRERALDSDRRVS